HDKPKTPYQRLMGYKPISEKTKQKLRSIYNSLDMIELRQEINRILQKLYEIQLIRSRKINMI
ncbi:MAG TPA: integrase, partial [Thermodesulfobacteriota bacterium]|nr:integrase [Thermodesulfobacteriota bacterium]